MVLFNAAAEMSAGFGWSLSDVALLTKVTIKVTKALDHNNGAKMEYRRALVSLCNLEAVLNEIRTILVRVDPVFRNALYGQLDVSTSSIALFHANLVKKYGAALSEDGSNDSFQSFSKKSWVGVFCCKGPV